MKSEITCFEMKIKYKYLWAWDRMLGSCYEWSRERQLEAEEDDAPDDVVYKDVNGKWHRFEEVECEDTKKRVQSIVDQMK